MCHSPPPRPVKRRHRAFTLIELLVVISIIALLVAILLPALGAIQRLTRTTICTNHIRSFAQAAYVYSTDWKQYVPTNDFNNPGQNGESFWPTRLAPYIDAEDIAALTRNELADTDVIKPMLAAHEIYQCPSLNTGDLGDHPVHYTVNNGVHDSSLYPQWHEVRLVNIDRIERSHSSVGFMTEVGRPHFHFMDMHSPQHTPFNNGQPAGARAISPDNDRHGGETTVGFFDGHVERRELVAEQFPDELWHFIFED